MTLPGSPSSYVYRYRTSAWEVQDNWTWVRGRHITRFGGTLLRRNLDGYLTFGRDGRYVFDTVLDFLFDSPARLVGTEPEAPASIGAGKLSNIVQLSEARAIMETLDECGGSRIAAAARLGISERTLRYRLAAFREAGIAMPALAGARR